MKKRTKIIVMLGVFCVLFCFASAWYSLTFNEGRLVKLMDFSVYTFIPKDIPMIAALITTILYGLSLTGWFVYTVIKNHMGRHLETRTRKLNPKLGLLGFLGFFGFLGFWTYSIDKMIFPFCFFVFFGFFGFFFEGKMSELFMDERFRENAQKAQFKSLKIGFTILFLSLIVLGRGKGLLGSLEHLAIAYTIVISLVLSIIVFLSEFLLYRYDQDEQSEE